jgi:hypothetical protein
MAIEALKRTPSVDREVPMRRIGLAVVLVLNLLAPLVAEAQR